MRIYLFAILLVLTAAGAYPQWKMPFPSLRVIRTEHFEIIYPPESEKTAQTLGGFADRVYGEVSGLLNHELSGRLTVAITPGTDSFNGYLAYFPYFHMVLLDAPASPTDFTTFRNNLEGLFTHELTHALSLSILQPGYAGLRRIFGGWVFPQYLTVPGFIAEGTAVTLESRDGITGRAFDPLVREGLLQAVFEDRFLNPVQAEDTYDLRHRPDNRYHYGGVFLLWLQETYGMERFVQLWVELGKLPALSFDVYKSGFFGIFTDVYHRPFPEVWNAWKETLRIPGIEENPEPARFAGTRRNPPQIAALDAGGGTVFALDISAGKVVAYDTARKTARTLTAADRTAYNLTVSPDGGRLLISAWRYAGALNNTFDELRTIATEYDAHTGRKTGRTWPGIYDARHFREGVIGLSADRHNTRIVYRSGNGKTEQEEILLQGDEELVFADPAPLNDVWIGFIAAFRGERRLCLLNYRTKEAFTLVSDSPDDAMRWRYIRGFRVSEGKLLFSYNHDYRMYKLGIADPGILPETHGEVIFSGRDFSGGVSQPAIAGGALYYRASFTQADAVMAFPESLETLTGTRSALTLTPWDAETRQKAGLDPPQSAGKNPQTAGKKPQSAGKNPQTAEKTETALPSRRYWGISYLNPFRFWVPFPLIRSDPYTDWGITVNGPGMFSIMADPIGLNTLTVSAAFDIPYLMGIFDLNWTTYALGFPLSFAFTDNLDTSRQLDFRVVRNTALSGTAEFRRGLGSERLYGALVAALSVNLWAPEPAEDWTTAYTWGYQPPKYLGTLGVGISSLYRQAPDLFGRGFSLYLYGRYDFSQSFPPEDQALPRGEAVFAAAFEDAFPLRLRLYGAWDQRGMNLAGHSKPFSTSAFEGIASKEYAPTAASQRTAALHWIAGGEAELKLFSLEIQRYASHLYFNRLFGALAYRGMVYDGGENPVGDRAFGTAIAGTYRLAQSVVFRLGTTVSTELAPALPFRLSFSAVGVWKLSALGREPNFWNNLWGTLEAEFSL